MMTAYQILLKVFQEKFGIIIFESKQEDFSISDYIVDSISFIEFIIAIEEELTCELSDDFINFDILSSAKVFQKNWIHILHLLRLTLNVYVKLARNVSMGSIFV